MSELNKMRSFNDESKVVQGFIDWLGENGYTIQQRCPEPSHQRSDAEWCPRCSETGLLGPVWDFNSLLADYFGIDLKQVERERRTLLQTLREGA